MARVALSTMILALGIAYLGAAILPCPTSDLDRSHAASQGDREQAPSLDAPCPCGCDHRPASRASFGKLGPVLVSLADTDAPAPPAAFGLLGTPGLPPEHQELLDPIPI